MKGFLLKSSLCLEQPWPASSIIYALPSPSPHRRPPIRRATTRIRNSSSSSVKSEPSSSTVTTTKTATTVKLTYLEFNGWLWDLDGGRFRVLVDPLLVGNLDFGMPWLFDGAKKTLPKDGLQEDLGGHGAATKSEVTVLATPGPVNGPPWQRPENSYVVTSSTTGEGQRKHSVYYEATSRTACTTPASCATRGLRADVLITPVIKQQLLASFTLVSGQEDAVELARLLGAAYVVPMNNGECDAKGLLTAVISTQGTTQAFRDLLADVLPQTQVVEPTPGVPLHLHFDDDN